MQTLSEFIDQKVAERGCRRHIYGMRTKRSGISFGRIVLRQQTLAMYPCQLIDFMGLPEEGFEWVSRETDADVPSFFGGPED